MKKTLYVKRAGHPDGRVLINEADFDPATDTPWTEEPVADQAEPETGQADPAEAGENQPKPAKSGKAGKSGQ